MYTPASSGPGVAIGFTALRPEVEPREAREPRARSASALVDLIDDALIGLSADGALLVANRAAWRLLDRGDTLMLRGGRPLPVDEGLQATWRAALQEAFAGRRRLLRPRGAGGARAILLQPGSADCAPVLARVGRDELGRQRLLGTYAQSIGLTVQETRVLEAIVQGESPEDIARRHRVSIATVRTQVRSMTIKAGVAGMRELVADALRAAC